MNETQRDPEEQSAEAPLYGLMAEYDSTEGLVNAARKVRDAGYKRWDTYTPFPVHGMDRAMGIKPTILPWFVLIAGFIGGGGGLLLQWWTNTYDYEWLISGKPFFSLPANIPITFELTVLLASGTALLSMLLLNKLPHPSHPLHLMPRFARVTDDRFFLVVEASDPKFDEADTRELLDETNPIILEDVPEDRVTSDKLPKGLVYGLIIATFAAILPFALFARARQSTMRYTRLDIIPDMDFQTKYKAQSENPFFTDDRAMRRPVKGTVAVDDLEADNHFYRGKVDGHWALTFPKEVPINKKTMRRGAHRFGIFCTPCHGQAGNGDGMINKRAKKLAQGGWVPPANLHDGRLIHMPVGELFNTITHGIRNMPAYGPQIKPSDRWAIILYVRALQLSRAAPVADVPPALRGSLK